MLCVYICVHDNNDVMKMTGKCVCVCCIVAECISDFYYQDVCTCICMCVLVMLRNIAMTQAAHVFT